MFGCIYVSDFPVQAALRYEAGIYLAESVASRKALPAESAGKDLSAEESVINASLTKPSSPKTSKISPTVASLDKVSFDQTSLIQKSFNNHQIAVLDGPANQMKVFACNGPARKAGIEIGMTKIQAEALPTVALRKRVLDHEFVAHAALLECAGRFSPRLESTCPGTVIIDLTGTERLTGTKKKIAEKLRDAAQECGLSVNVALARNADTALYAALGSGSKQGVTVIEKGDEGDSLSDLPVRLFQVANLQAVDLQFASRELENLQSANSQIKNHQITNRQSGKMRSGKSYGAQPDIADIMDALSGWGIRDFKALGALPSVALTQRLGQYGLHLQQLAKGEVQRELVPYVEASSFQQSMELEECIDLLEPLGVVLGELLERVLLQLINRSLATDRIQVDLDLEIHTDCQLQSARKEATALEPTYQRMLKLPVPTQDAKIILKLLELDLAGKPPHAPVKKVRVEAFPARIKFGQTGLFQPVTPEPARLEVTLARLRSVVGDKVVGDKDEHGRSLVGFPVILDSNRPDSFDVLVTMPASKTKKLRGVHRTESNGEGVNLGSDLGGDMDGVGVRGKSIVPRHAMRVLRPPAEVKVGLRARVPSTISFGDVRSKVVQVSGPWRTSGSWWDKNQAWNREEWDVEVQWQEGHGIFRIFRDAASDRWYVEGIYA
jgi:protein ImuB